MSDDSPFPSLADDSDESIEDDEHVDEQADPETATDTGDTPESDAESDAQEVGDSEPEPETEPVDPLQHPAFEYDKDIREYFYARPETWGRFEDLIFNAQVALRQEYDLRDVPKRELHDAAMQAFLEHTDTDEIVENVIEARKEGAE